MDKIGFKKIAFTGLALTVGIFANVDSGRYLQGMKYYEEGEYKKAFPIILEEAKEKDNKAAQYRLAEMYEQGRGTKVDYKEASVWFRKAAGKYSFIKKGEISSKSDETFSDRLKQQIGEGSEEAGIEFALAKVDTNTAETKKMMTALLDGNFFGLKPYNINYLLPFSYSQDKPNRVSPYVGSTPGGDETYNQNTEVIFQLSVKKVLTFNLFGWDEYITAAYTQKVWWQLYDESAPFRETNYQPEFFMTIPSSQSLDDAMGLKAFKLGFIHESNGQEGYRSRSWNRLYIMGIWQWDNLFLAARVWHRIEEDRRPDWYYEQDPAYGFDEIAAQSEGDDNPDITDYLGYGDIKLDYLYEDHHFGLMLRNNFDFDENKGAVEFTYAYPFFDSPDTSLYVKIFTGYGESLIDYNVNVTKASIGFSFSNGIF